LAVSFVGNRNSFRQASKTTNLAASRALFNKAKTSSSLMLLSQKAGVPGSLASLGSFGGGWKPAHCDATHSCIEPPSALPRLCLACGHSNSAQARFCSECGASPGKPSLGPSTVPRVPVAPASSGERRQLDNMFCDMVGQARSRPGSTPREQREVVATFQASYASEINASVAWSPST
jgi:hypothetical protein